MDAESTCPKCSKRDSSLEKENSELKEMLQQLKSWLNDIPCAWMPDSQTIKKSKMSVANLSSNQGQSSQDKKNQSPHKHPRSLLKHRPAQSSNASEAGTSNQQKSLDDAVVFADDPEGDSVGVDSVEDNPGRQEDVDTAMEEEEDYGNDDKSDDYVLGDDDPLSIDDKSDDNESGGDDPLSRGHADPSRRRKKKQKKFKCELCGKILTRKRYLENHMAVHYGGLKCDLCEKSFGSPGNLKHHMDAAHGSQVYYCSPCQKPFTSKYYLHTHQRKSKRHIQKTQEFRRLYQAEDLPVADSLVLVSQEEDSKAFFLPT